MSKISQVILYFLFLNACVAGQAPVPASTDYEFLPSSLRDEFDFRFALTTESPEAGIELVVNWQSPENLYRLRLAKGEVRLTRVTEGLALPLGWCAPKFSLRQGTNDIVLKRRREYLRLYVNGSLVAEGFDSTYRGGRLGVRVWPGKVSVARPRYQPIGDLFLADDFMREESHSVWETVSGQWELQSIQNVSMSSNPFAYRGVGEAEPALTVIGQRFWDSYRFLASVRVPLEGFVGLVAFFQDPNNYYLLRWGSGPDAKLEIVKVAEGRPESLASREVASIAGHWYRVALDVLPGVLEASVDSYRLLRVKDDTYYEGRPGLYVNGSSGALFDDVVVSRLRDLRDDFDGPNSGLWQPLAGQWTRAGSLFGSVFPGDPCLVVASERPARMLLRRDPGPWYRFEADTFSLDGGFGLCFGYLDEQSHWIARLSSEGAELIERKESETTVHHRVSRPFLPALRRVAVRVQDNVVQVLVDGQVVLSAACSTRLRGAVGLYASASTHTAFDNAILRFIPRPQPVFIQHEVFGRETTMANWSVAQSDWLTTEWSGTPAKWHRGSFFGDVSVQTRLAAKDGAEARLRFCLGARDDRPESGATLELALADAAEIRLLQAGRVLAQRADLPLPLPCLLSFCRRGRFLVVQADDKPLICAPMPDSVVGDQIGWSSSGFSLEAKDIEILSDHCRIYTFHQAPADWLAAAGDWQVTNRWQCDPRWSFFSGVSRNLAALWNKRRFRGDVTLEFAAGIKMDRSRGKYKDYAADINLTLCGDGKDLTSGYNLMFGGWGNSVTRILRNNTVVAETRSVRVPTGDLHRRWLYVRGERCGRQVRLLVDNRLVLEFDDPDPLPGERAAIWTWNNGVMVARVRISGAEVIGPSLPQSRTDDWGLCAYNHPSQPGVLGEQLARLKSTDADELAAAAIELGKLRDPAAVAALVPLLKVEDDNCRWQAAAALAAIGLPGVKALLRALDDPDEQVRWKIEAALRRCGRVAVPLIAQTLQRGEVRARRSCAYILRDLPCPETGAALCPALGDHDEDVRWKAADSLVQLGGDAIPAVVRTLRSESVRARQAAAWVLHQLGHETPLSALLGALDDVDKDVRDKAAIALKERGPKPEQAILDALAVAGKRPRPHLLWILGEWQSPALKAAAAATSAEVQQTHAPEKTTIRFTIESQPPGASVFLDDRFLGVAPGAFAHASPGRHLLRLCRAGHRPWTKTVEIGDAQKLRVVLEPESHLAMTVASSPSSASVYVADQFKGRTPLTITNLKAGNYHLRIERKGFLAVKKQVELRPNRAAEVSVRLVSNSEDYYLRSLARDPNSAAHHTELAHLYMLRNEFDQAKEQFLHAFRIVESGSDTSDYHGRLQQEIRKAHTGFYDYGGGKALQQGRRTLEVVFSQLTKAHPAGYYYHYTLGVVRYELAAAGDRQLRDPALNSLRTARTKTNNAKIIKQIDSYIAAATKLPR